jgi:hypothetical protein
MGIEGRVCVHGRVCSPNHLYINGLRGRWMPVRPRLGSDWINHSIINGESGCKLETEFNFI